MNPQGSIPVLVEEVGGTENGAGPIGRHHPELARRPAVPAERRRPAARKPFAD